MLTHILSVVLAYLISQVLLTRTHTLGLCEVVLDWCLISPSQESFHTGVIVSGSVLLTIGVGGVWLEGVEELDFGLA